MIKFTVISILLFCVFNLNKIDGAPTTTKSVAQKLQHKDGYVPVYIRIGDTPLYEINPDLAEAFRETELAQHEIQTKKESNDNLDSKKSKEDDTIQNSLTDDISKEDEKKSKKLEKQKI